MVARSFAHEIRHFSRATAVISQDDFTDVLRMAQKYLKDKAYIHKIELVLQTKIEGELGLEPQDWDDNDRYGAYLLRKKDGSPNGQNACSFIHGRPLWIVSKNEEVLEDSSDYLDLWSDRSEIPKFTRFPRKKDWSSDDETRVLISIPTELFTKTLAGILYFESSQRLKASKQAKEELMVLAEGLCTLHELVVQTKESSKKTSQAVEELRLGVEEKIDLQVSKATLFFAYSGNSDDEVVGHIKSVLDEFFEDIDVIDWKEISESGEINNQIINSIRTSKYSICYFSEKDDASKGTQHFRDNPNVLFEAGMIHMSIQDPRVMPQGCLLIREVPPPKVPFDFSTLRIVEVERKNDGALNAQAFESMLRDSLKTLLKDELD